MADWSQQREWLRKEQARIRDRLERTDAYQLAEEMRDELSELSSYDNHPGDIGSETFERGKDVGLRDLDKLRLQEVDRALDAIDSGTYGICQRCGTAIPPERLEAYPMSTLCVPCKQADERAHPDRSRPVEEEVLIPPFSRTDTDETSSVVFDGEDAWQEVARYNQMPGLDANQHNQSEDEYVADNDGLVDDMDRISNEEYRSQLP